jgi:CRP-like cAMP-binding protein
MEPAAADPIRVLLSTYLFQDLSPAELEPLLSGLQSRQFQRGEFVFHAGDRADHLHVVATGQVKYFMTTVDGDEYVYEVLTPGAVFGEPGIFAPERNRVVDAMAMGPSSVLLISREPFIDFMQGHRPVMMRIIEAFAADSRLAVETVTDLGYADIRRRVVRKLLEIAITHGSERDDGSIDIALTVSQATLAGLVGATRENVNRALSALSSAGDVEIVDGRFRLPDPVALRRKADRGWTPLFRRNRLAEQRLGG